MQVGALERTETEKRMTPQREAILLGILGTLAVLIALGYLVLCVSRWMGNS